jgi:hypothetical protein
LTLGDDGEVGTQQPSRLHQIGVPGWPRVTRYLEFGYDDGVRCCLNGCSDFPVLNGVLARAHQALAGNRSGSMHTVGSHQKNREFGPDRVNFGREHQAGDFRHHRIAQQEVKAHRVRQKGCKRALAAFEPDGFKTQIPPASPHQGALAGLHHRQAG